MIRRLVVVGAVAVLAACGGSSAPATTQAPSSSVATTADVVASSTTVASEITTTQVPGTTVTTTGAVPTTTLGVGQAAIRIDEIVLAGEPYLVLANKGSGAGSTDGLWICQFPAYFKLPAFDLLPGERLAVPLGEGSLPDLVGFVATVETVRPLGTVAASSGELGLYMADRFNDAAAIVDYVEWGSAGHARSSVAVAAQIWSDGGFVAVPPEVLAIVAQSFPTLGPDDWFAEIGG